jgi:VIT1/CCC1 family predicted Fe2+/Mn2+ transporter
MPQTPHIERHFTSSEAVRDIVIGMADGLTVPFALAAGLSGAIKTTHVIVVAGLAEIAAGSIAMGLGGYLAAKSDAEHYVQERAREWREVKEIPDEEAREVSEILQTYGMEVTEADTVVAALEKRPEAWVDFMMRFELGLEPPEAGRAVRSAATIAASYVGGGLIPLAPYIVLNQASTAFVFSVCVTLIALAAFGYIKGRFTGSVPFRSASQTLVTGALAAAAAYVLARLIS